MALVVNTNMQSMRAATNLNRTNRALGDTFTRISTGRRINKAADDAAGMAVAEGLDASQRSLNMARRNALDGIGVIQVAEGATAEVANILKRMRELAVQSASETLADKERVYLDAEFTQLSIEIGRIATTTTYNGVGLNRGTTTYMGVSGLTRLEVQVGINNSTSDRITITLGDLRSSQLGVATGSIDISSVADARNSLDSLDSALQEVSRQRAGYGTSQNRLQSTINNLDSYVENLAAAESQIRDADFALEAAELNKYQIMQQAGISVLSQANSINQGAVQLLQ